MERVGSGTKLIRKKLARGEFIGLPSQSLNKRVSLVKVTEDTAVIVVWSKNAHTIITTLTVQQYIQKHGHLLSESTKQELSKYCSIEREGGKLLCSIKELCFA
jgi:hypothetical protein